MSKSIAPPAKAGNGRPPEAKIVRFAVQDDPAPTPAIKLPRDHPRDGESKPDWITATAKGLGLVRHDASLSARRKEQLAADLLERAQTDELFGGSKTGKALLEASEIWHRMNPEIEGDLGHLSDSSKDLLGRSVRGPALAVALVLESLSEDPTTTLTPAEHELVRSLAPEVVAAIGAYEAAVIEHGEAIVASVNAAQLAYPPGAPGVPVDRRDVEEASA